MSFMQKTAFEQIENHQLEKILDEYQQSRYLFKSIRRAVILIFSLIFSVFILNITVGCILYVLNLSSHIMSHSVSGLVISLYLIAFSLGILYRYTYILKNPLVLVDELSAQKIDESTEQLTQQNFSIYDLNQHIAQQFSTSTIDIFVVDEASIQCFNFYLNYEVKQIFVSKGMLHHLSQQELYQVLIAQYILILSGEARECSHYFICLQGYMMTTYYANRLIFIASNKRSTSSKIKYNVQFYIGWILKALSIVDAWIYQRVQHYLFHQDFSLDYYITQYSHHYAYALQRMSLYEDLLNLQRIDLTYLSPLAFNQANDFWWSSALQHLKKRLSKLGHWGVNFDISYYITDSYHKSVEADAVYQQSLFLRGKLFQFDYQKNQFDWQNPSSQVVMSKQFNPQNRHSDQIRPLNPSIRTQQARAYLKQILPTTSHRLHVLSYIFELRKVHEPSLIQTKDISAAVTMVFYKADQRLLLEMFEQCHMELNIPTIVVKPYILTWSKIIQSDGQIHLLDALMLERVKAKWQLLGKNIPKTLSSVMYSVARLVQAVCYVQPFIISEQVYHLAYKETFDELYPEYLPLEIDYHQVFQDLAGLNVEEKLKVLNLIEQLLWHHQKITQDAYDVIILLYWRLGFNHEQMKQMLYKRSQIAIW